MDSSRKLKVVVQGLMEGTHVRGRPSRTCLDDILDWGGEDVNTLARKAQDRPLWETTIKKAMRSPQLKNVESAHWTSTGTPMMQ